ncbi:pantoate-beta-alanine ligase [Vanrija albida]|uniref:Pantoate--beta-alanine ligase n=1 Tax=Vanrija albida TaxID=181172 RepID=A0ABR3Q1G3_9TREE
MLAMGALHEGHLSLVKTSLKRHPFTVMTLFVNPMQFAPHEDLSAYPRTFERDMDSLRSLLPTGPESPIHGLGISEYDGRPTPRSQRQPSDSPLVVFAPTADVMYPLRGELQDMSRRKGASVEVRGWGEVMEGASRPQFFTGVATVVTKLFNAVEPDHAYFGQKDIQQALLLKIMLTDLLVSHPTSDNLHILPTRRDPETGLALSSRNAYLSAAERKVAPTLARALEAGRAAWSSGGTGEAIIEAATAVVKAEEERVKASGEDVDLRLDYFEVFEKDTFTPVRGIPATGQLAIAGAMFVGKTRLIDNLLLGWEAEEAED